MQHEVGAQAAHPRLAAQRSDDVQQGIGQRDLWQKLSGLRQSPRQRGLLGPPAGSEALRVGLVGHAAADDLGAFGGLLGGRHVHAQAETVEELRTQASLLGVHAAHQGQAGRGLGTQGIALHPHHAQRGGVEQHIHQMVGEQVHLVDVQQPAVRLGQQTGPQPHLAPQRRVEVQRAHHAVLGRAQGQVDERSA